MFPYEPSPTEGTATSLVPRKGLIHQKKVFWVHSKQSHKKLPEIHQKQIQNANQITRYFQQHEYRNAASKKIKFN